MGGTARVKQEVGASRSGQSALPEFDRTSESAPRGEPASKSVGGRSMSSGADQKGSGYWCAD